MATTKKAAKKPTKKPKNKYEEKVKVNVSFDQVMNAMLSKPKKTK